MTKRRSETLRQKKTTTQNCTINNNNNHNNNIKHSENEKYSDLTGYVFTLRIDFSAKVLNIFGYVNQFVANRVLQKSNFSFK